MGYEQVERHAPHAGGDAWREVRGVAQWQTTPGQEAWTAYDLLLDEHGLPVEIHVSRQRPGGVSEFFLGGFDGDRYEVHYPEVSADRPRPSQSVQSPAHLVDTEITATLLTSLLEAHGTRGEEPEEITLIGIEAQGTEKATWEFVGPRPLGHRSGGEGDEADAEAWRLERGPRTIWIWTEGVAGESAVPPGPIARVEDPEAGIVIEQAEGAPSGGDAREWPPLER